MAEPALKAMSLDEFLDWEAEQERRYELVDGRPVMMTGGTVAHDFVRGELAGEIRAQLKGKPCRMAIDVKIACPTGNVRYPDVAIHCGPFRPRDKVASGPRVVIEVLSNSTKATDFLGKLIDYQSVPDISAYLIFWQNEARVLVHRRSTGGWAAEELRGRKASVALDDVGVVIVLEAIYGELLDVS